MTTRVINFKKLTDFTNEELKVIQQAYNAIKALEEEKKAISKDILREKEKAAEQLNISKKNVNNIIKYIKFIEKDEDFSENFEIAKNFLHKE